MLKSIPNEYKEVLEKEMATFPTGKRDDILDAIAYFPIILDKMHYDYRARRYSRQHKKVTYMSDVKRKLREGKTKYNEQYAHMNY
jgi:hypothetical protein